jgi:citrate lyase beta subunit
VPHIDLKRPDDLSEETRKFWRLASVVRPAIHPQQISIIHAGVCPIACGMAWATALLQATTRMARPMVHLFSKAAWSTHPVLRKARRVVELSSLTQ